MNKKLINIILILITSISLIGITTLVVMNQYIKGLQGNQEPTIDQVLEATVDISEITTNLKSDNIVQISLKMETTDKKAKEELEKRDFQVRDIVISVLSNMEAKELEGQNGITILKEKIKNNVNELMQNGEVKQVYITSFILQ